MRTDVLRMLGLCVVIVAKQLRCGSLVENKANELATRLRDLLYRELVHLPISLVRAHKHHHSIHLTSKNRGIAE